MAKWPFKPSRASEDAARLLDAVTAAGRQPELYAAGRIPDTLEGRFEAMALHGALALMRLAADPGAGPLAQAFTDKLFRAFDAGLREAGVGDTSVPKRMRVLASNFYGRLDAYRSAIGGGDRAALGSALGRNILADEAHGFSVELADHVLAVANTQAGAPVDALFVASGWPAAPA